MARDKEALLLVHLVVCVSIGLNWSILRESIGFIYLSFVPGYAILRSLRYDPKSVLEMILYSIGLSVAFLMFVGLFMNNLYPLFGVPKPLSFVPLTATIMGLTLGVILINYLYGSVKESQWNFTPKASALNILRAVILALPPIMSLAGAAYHSTLMLLAVVVALVGLFALAIFTDVFTSKLYPLLILTVSLTLIFQTAALSMHLMGGSDIYSEFYVFEQAQTDGIWRPPGLMVSYSLIANLNSLLSVTILPTIYSSILNMSGESTFKILYPLLFSLVPLALYRIYAGNTSRYIALLSAFFFMSSPVVFYGLELVSLSRQIVAELFLVLSVLLLVKTALATSKDKMLFIVFGAGIVVSHYSIAMIYVFYLACIYILYPIASNYIFPARKNILKMGNLLLVLLLMVFAFSWYLYVSNSPLNQMANSLTRILDTIGLDMFNPQSRFPSSFSSLSPLQSSSVVGLMQKWLVYVEEFFIVVGTIVIMMRPRVFKFNEELRLLMLVSAAILGISIIIPNLAPTFNLTRIYHVAILFLSPLFILGGTTVLSWIEKAVAGVFKTPHKLNFERFGLRTVALIMVVTFLFEIGFINNITNSYPYSYSLDFNRKQNYYLSSVRIDFYSSYVPDQDVASAAWLGKEANPLSTVYADDIAKYSVLTSYALINRDRIYPIYNTTELLEHSFIYLKSLNVKENVMLYPVGYYNTSEISYLLDEANRVYSNGDSEICHKG